ncbi:hypothetical protein PILCRDRAFT_824575 [Piloderma croceum F 1598]|uniref:Uncharacterized protein n=1 Tax=Piloderma croceum (strain F 1598) TaxID=765440 RepID=A0A0C3BM16_PILCF|nr:hypothetical protein PILCRDRAFT_824575 [Piloderma croceum F 1598]
MDQLIHEHSILLGMSIDDSTTNTYSSATNSYLAFCNLPINPTPETLSYYITFQSSHISPKSIESVQWARALQIGYLDPLPSI